VVVDISMEYWMSGGCIACGTSSNACTVLSVPVASARLFILSVLQITSPVVRQRNQLAALETDVVAIGIDQRAP